MDGAWVFWHNRPPADPPDGACAFRAILALVRRVCTLRPLKHQRPGGRVAATMLTLCEGCGHRLWSEARSAGAFRFLAHFDDDEGSATYAEHSPSCPSCGLKLDAGMTGPEAPGEHFPRGG